MTRDKVAVVARIKEVGAVAILRTETPEQALGAAKAVIAGGFRIVEVTYGVPNRWMSSHNSFEKIPSY